MDEGDLQPASICYGANLNVYPQFSRIEDVLPRRRTSVQRLQRDY